MKYVSGFDKVKIENDKFKATIIEALALSVWDAVNLQRTTAAARV